MPYIEFCQQMYNDLYYQSYNQFLNGRTSQAAQTTAQSVMPRNLRSKKPLSVRWKDIPLLMKLRSCGVLYMLHI